MTTFYSEHYSAKVGVTGHFTTLLPAPPQLSPGEAMSRMRRTEARIQIAAATVLADADIIRIMDMRSSDRLFNLYFTVDANFGATSTFNIGLYKKGYFNDGAVIDLDLFASAVDFSGAIARVDQFKEATTLTDMDRGRPLWYLADKGGGTYTADPYETWTISMEPSQLLDATDDVTNILVEAYYVAGI